MPSHEETPEQLAAVLADAVARTGERACNLEVYSWPQTWPNTSLGFGGMAGQAVTAAQTHVVVYGWVHALVYFGGQPAYECERLALFQHMMDSGRMFTAPSVARSGAIGAKRLEPLPAPTSRAKQGPDA